MTEKEQIVEKISEKFKELRNLLDDFGLEIVAFLRRDAEAFTINVKLFCYACDKHCIYIDGRYTKRTWSIECIDSLDMKLTEILERFFSNKGLAIVKLRYVEEIVNAELSDVGKHLEELLVSPVDREGGEAD